MSELEKLGQALSDSNIEEAREHLMSLAYKLNKMRRLLKKLELEKVRDELNSII